MNLISKKDLLAQTGISYGQLYRWKRQRLIPDEWFVKQSSYTGQETFFPREQILSRVQSILELKDGHSMEELARMFSPEEAGTTISAGELREVGEISTELLDALEGHQESYRFSQVALLAILSQAAEIPAKERAELFKGGATALHRAKIAGLVCVIFQAQAKYHIVFAQGTLLFGDDITVLGAWPMDEWAGKLKVNHKDKWK